MEAQSIGGYFVVGDECIVFLDSEVCGGPATGGMWREHGAYPIGRFTCTEGMEPTHRVTKCFQRHDPITGRDIPYVEVEPLEGEGG